MFTWKFVVLLFAYFSVSPLFLYPSVWISIWILRWTDDGVHQRAAATTPPYISILLLCMANSNEIAIHSIQTSTVSCCRHSAVSSFSNSYCVCAKWAHMQPTRSWSICGGIHIFIDTYCILYLYSIYLNMMMINRYCFDYDGDTFISNCK